MLMKKVPLLSLFISTRLDILGKNTVHHLHSDARRQNFFKIVRKAAGHSNSVLSHSTLKNLLQNCKSVREQIDTFLTYVQLSEQDVSNRLLMCKDIENALRTTFPESSVHPVGSSVSGLGLRGCDLDLSFHYSASNPNSPAQNIVVTNVDVSSGKVPASDFPYLPLKQQLIFIQKVLKESGITEVTTVVPGRFPILNFSCNDLGCDLSINNRSALQGTRLMQACSKLDHRVAPLFQLITYWGKHFYLIGGPLKFKSYAIFLMIVYFLQKRYPPILPALQSVLQKIDLNEDKYLFSEGKDTSEVFSPSSNSENLEMLLREFFFFYANFDFTSVICTLDRNVWDGKSFIIKEPTFELNTINVQDPFNLSWNVTTGVDWKHSKSLIKSLLSACEAYHESSDQPITNQNWGLLAMLDRSSANYSFARKETVEMKIQLDKTDEISENWIQICDNVFCFLQDCLLFECHPVDSKTIKFQIDKTAVINKTIAYNKKYGKLRTFEKVDKTSTTDNVTNILFSHSMYVTVLETWRGRSNYFYQDDIESKQIFVGTEQQISNQILEKCVENSEEKFIFICDCSVISIGKNIFLNIIMRAVNKPVFIPKLRIFLKEYFLKYSRFL
ncbi:poly(A) RNA polymerase, mitochondrial isoform X1 [Parasteatoda tepidariorum]|uniref:poly(A) RNA polymerase, mitochondrial isoform X1 n=2 Tax=Parasteatoda tepidariorum TaxID=114398 RepID=UPI001C720EEF|nr:poly(A) RNA polymerase, mitochondrial isoform X1 [Parasteatoda tepidariorum]XP_015927699.2 poly(A) RNA polymerase, mitochondrial isoform X1 [Parasteatoda tepidariorum]XP_015927700.2 poly(A) RNA polymerase, mitochondrial isoform X1 [Parasteatoda tepidariorum]XP_015927701.2 poly(A) RNA polymerase, mitochondrial isoform X1 [Parasteatoda tepidariorum]